MKIFVQQSGHSLGNMGDLAMLQVALHRLRNLWPNALLTVVTERPDRLRLFCPDAQPLNSSGYVHWFRSPLQRLYKLLPSPSAQRLLVGVESGLRQRLPDMAHSLTRSRLKARRIDSGYFDAFLQAIRGADLVVATGGGYVTDTFEGMANSTLGILELAIRLNKPTVMFGQGLGPIANPALRARAQAVLPAVRLIALREKRGALPLLDSLGILSRTRTVTTGDDAIEMVYAARAMALGRGIGVNLRLARYAQVGSELLQRVRATLQDVARAKGAPLLPVPIAQLEDSDIETIRQLLVGHDDSSDGGASLDTPGKVIEQVSHCRVVVTGSYHAGVFALAQGIPIVGLVKSDYYVGKFLGLADQFGGIGCEVVSLSDERLPEKLTRSIDNAWQSAETVRPQLLELARQQIDLSLNAYRQARELFD